MSYKDELTKANTKLAQNPKVRFIGYGLKKGRALGTLKEVADSQIIEMPSREPDDGFCNRTVTQGIPPSGLY